MLVILTRAHDIQKRRTQTCSAISFFLKEMITLSNRNKFTSQRVQEQIPEWIQSLLWHLIETMDVPTKDHVQFFELSIIDQDSEKKQKVTHYQLEPFYQNQLIVSASNTLTAKIVVIESETHSAMLLLTTPQKYLEGQIDRC